MRNYNFIYITAAVFLNSCCHPSVHASKPVLRGNYNLVPTNVAFASVKATGELKRALIWYSIINKGSFEVAAKRYEHEFYVDGDVVAFDRGSSPISAHGKIDYSCTAPLSVGSHTYKLIVRALTGEGTSVQGNELSGTFRLQ
jgi:hypothetical protein